MTIGKAYPWYVNVLILNKMMAWVQPQTIEHIVYPGRASNLLGSKQEMAKKNIQYVDTRKKPTEVTIDLRDIEKMASIGLTQEEMAYIKGICPETFTRQKGNNEELSQAILIGKANAKAFLLNRMRSISNREEIDSVTYNAIKYLLNTMHGINEKSGVELEGKIQHEVKVSMEEFEKAMKDEPGAD